MKKILIVDDEQSLLLLLNTKLRAQGYDIIAALDPIQGYKMALEQNPDLILLDLHMPAGGGDGLFDNLKNNIKTSMIPVIFMTAEPTENMKEIILSVGAAGFVTKPIDTAELLGLIKAALGEG